METTLAVPVSTTVALPQCENKMIWNWVETRRRVVYAMDQTCGWCVEKCILCCRNCSCDPLDIVLCLYIWENYND